MTDVSPYIEIVAQFCNNLRVGFLFCTKKATRNNVVIEAVVCRIYPERPQQCTLQRNFLSQPKLNLTLSQFWK